MPVSLLSKSSSRKAPSPEERKLALQFANYLFFIASERAGQLVPEFVWVKMSKSETANEALRFVDQADLFGDGQEEIVAVLTYYENYRCLIYRRTKGGANWGKIFETEVRGCL
jgi:hypothetical protein